MTMTKHMDTRASSLAETGYAHRAPRRGLLMRRRKALAAPWLLALVLGGLVGACGGPALTSTTIEGGATIGSRYFGNVISTQEPRDMERVGNFIERRIVERGDNQSDMLEQIVVQSGGRCIKAMAMVACKIDRKILLNDCFRDSCTRRIKQWTVDINWANRTGLVQPRVKINMTTQQLSN